jgi:hypothetical protein
VNERMRDGIETAWNISTGIAVANNLMQNAQAMVETINQAQEV